jgi:hypothetical protein
MREFGLRLSSALAFMCSDAPSLKTLSRKLISVAKLCCAVLVPRLLSNSTKILGRRRTEEFLRALEDIAAGFRVAVCGNNKPDRIYVARTRGEK